MLKILTPVADYRGYRNNSLQVKSKNHFKDMETKIIKGEKEKVIKLMQGFMVNDNITIQHLSFFFDTIDETYTAVINYHI